MKKILLVLALFAGMLQISCSTDSVSGTQTTAPADVYVAGSKNGQACYWKNNLPVLLDSQGFSETSAAKIIVSNSDVYVFGSGTAALDGNPMRLFWKNGVLTNLSVSLSSNVEEFVNITDMEVDGNDLYFVGYVHDPSATNVFPALIYWKNGIPNPLKIYENTNFQQSDVKIKIANNTVYAAGVSNNDGAPNGYCINTVFTEIPNAALNGFAARGNEMFVYGSVSSPGQEGFYRSIATGESTNLSFPAGNGVTGLFFEGDNMYYTNGEKIYKNATVVYPGMSSHIILDFKVSGDNLYLIRSLVDDSDSSGSLIINNVMTMDAAAGESFNSLYVVQN